MNDKILISIAIILAIILFLLIYSPLVIFHNYWLGKSLKDGWMCDNPEYQYLQRLESRKVYNR